MRIISKSREQKWSNKNPILMGRNDPKRVYFLRYHQELPVRVIIPWRSKYVSKTTEWGMQKGVLEFLFGIAYFWSILFIFGILLASIDNRRVYRANSLVLMMPFLAFIYFVWGNFQLVYKIFPIFSVLIPMAAFRVYQLTLLYYNNLETFHRLFVNGIFCFVVLIYV